MTPKRMSTRRLVDLALMSAVAALLSFVEIPVIPMAPFLKYDPSFVPAFLAALAWGAPCGMVVGVVAAVIHGMLTGNPVGAAMNAVVVCAFVAPVAMVKIRNAKAVAEEAKLAVAAQAAGQGGADAAGVSGDAGADHVANAAATADSPTAAAASGAPGAARAPKEPIRYAWCRDDDYVEEEPLELNTPECRSKLVMVLLGGVVVSTGTALLANLTIGVWFWFGSVEVVAPFLIPALLPFNLAKGLLNSAFVLLVYRRVAPLFMREGR